MAKAPKLRVIGRAGIGVDNIDVEAATNAGVLVMNTPYGNAMTTAEHAIALMFALPAMFPRPAHPPMQASEKARFVGTELNGKTLGLIGAGNIGSIVARRRWAWSKVIAYDPFLSEERATELHVKKVGFDDLLKMADLISLHVPKTPDTANILDAPPSIKPKGGDDYQLRTGRFD